MSTQRKSTIPDVPSGHDEKTRLFLDAVKDNVEKITGRGRGSKPLTKLASTATTAQIITTLNAVIDQING